MANTVKLGDIFVGKYEPNFYEVVEVSGNTVSLRKLDRTVRMTMLDYRDTTYYDPIKGQYSDDNIHIRELKDDTYKSGILAADGIGYGELSLKIWDGETIVKEYRYAD